MTVYWPARCRGRAVFPLRFIGEMRARLIELGIGRSCLQPIAKHLTPMAAADPGSRAVGIGRDRCAETAVRVVSRREVPNGKRRLQVSIHAMLSAHRRVVRGSDLLHAAVVRLVITPWVEEPRSGSIDTHAAPTCA